MLFLIKKDLDGVETGFIFLKKEEFLKKNEVNFIKILFLRKITKFEITPQLYKVNITLKTLLLYFIDLVCIFFDIKRL